MKRIKNIFKKSKKNISFLDKRQRFVIQTLILAFGIILIHQNSIGLNFPLIILISIVTYILTAWSLKEDIKGVEWLLLFILPIMFTVSISLFYFLLPNRMIYRLFVTLLFMIGNYAILLVENIYNVAVIRSIQLTRAAQSVGLFITLISLFLLSNIIYSFRLPFYLSFISLFIISFLFSIQSLWSINLEEKLYKNIIFYSLIVAIGIGELASVLSFWPVENATYALLLSSLYYGLISIFQQNLAGRLFRNLIREYIFVFAFALILTILITNWD